MCVDYTDLNKHCLKDPFTLPHIDQVIDSTAGYVLLSFFDCYLGYHQIALKEEDQIKTAFITPFGAYAYTIISFGLKIAGATYQRAIKLCLADQLHRNVLKPTWMTWSSRPDPTTSSSLISRKPSRAYASSDGSSTQPSVSSVYHKGNYSGSSLVTEELKPTWRKSSPLQTWMPHGRSRMSRSSQAVWRPEIDLSRNLENGA
jgi:hypothetical protein